MKNLPIWALILIVLFVNHHIGAVVNGLIDDEDQSLWKWYNRCPDPTGISQEIYLQIWPYSLYLWHRNGNKLRP
jgi:hypothetical protein